MDREGGRVLRPVDHADRRAQDPHLRIGGASPAAYSMNFETRYLNRHNIRSRAMADRASKSQALREDDNTPDSEVPTAASAPETSTNNMTGAPAPAATPEELD